MDESVERKQRQRLQLLRKCYEESSGSERRIMDMWSIGESLGLTRDETQSATEYLKGESLLQAKALGGKIGITHWGVKEIEQAEKAPDQPTAHFLPINILQIENAIGSQIQQGALQSVQKYGGQPFDHAALLQLLNTIRNSLDENQLDEEQKAAVEADVQSVEAQLKKRTPNDTIIRESLRSIRSIFEGVIGNAAFQAVSRTIMTMLGGA